MSYLKLMWRSVVKFVSNAIDPNRLTRLGLMSLPPWRVAVARQLLPALLIGLSFFLVCTGAEAQTVEQRNYYVGSYGHFPTSYSIDEAVAGSNAYWAHGGYRQLGLVVIDNWGL